MNKLKKLLAKMSELYQAAKLMDSYDVDDFLASRDFKPRAGSKAQREHDEAMDWANKKVG